MSLDSRLAQFLIVMAVLAAMALGAHKLLQQLAVRSGPGYARKFGAEQSRIVRELGTSATLNVSFNYQRGEPLKVIVDHIAIQSGVPITYAGSDSTNNGLGYSGKLAAGLANFCVNEGVTFTRTSAGTFEILPE